MKLLVSFKICPDLDKLNPNDLEIWEGTQVNLRFLPTSMNCYDESCLELALRLRDKCSSATPIELSALTVGNEQADLTLQTLKALGYAHTIRAKETQDLRFKPHIVAQTIAHYAKLTKQDLLVLGQEAPLGNHGSIPQQIANKLNIPLVANVIDLIALEGDKVTVQIVEEHSVYQQQIKLPCVLMVGNAIISKLRVPTLRDRVACKNEKIEYLDVCAGKSKPHPRLVCLTVPNRARQGYISKKQGQQAVEDVLEVSLQERLNKL